MTEGAAARINNVGAICRARLLNRILWQAVKSGARPYAVGAVSPFELRRGAAGGRSALAKPK